MLNVETFREVTKNIKRYPIKTKCLPANAIASECVNFILQYFK